MKNKHSDFSRTGMNIAWDIVAVFAQKVQLLINITIAFEPRHDNTNKMACVPREGSDQTGWIRVLAARSMGS